MIKKPPLDELSAAVGRILGVLLTQEKVDDAVHHLAQAVKESIPSAVGGGSQHPRFQRAEDQHGFHRPRRAASRPFPV